MKELLANSEWLDDYSLIWSKPGGDSGAGMPCGGHDIGLLAWVEGDDLLFYIDRSGSFDENHQMLKLGRVRVSLSPSPFSQGQPFRQELSLREGALQIVAGSPEVRIRIWVEVGRPVAHVEVESDQPTKLRAVYENWRLERRETPQKHSHAIISLRGYDKPVYTWPDTIDFDEEGVVFYHRNRDDDLLINKLIRQQGLESVAGEIPDTQKGRTFGGWMGGPGLVPDATVEGTYIRTKFRGWPLVSQSAECRHELRVVCHTDQIETIDEWTDGLRALVSQELPSLSDAKQTAQAWWANFWDRSHISIRPDNADADDPVWQVGRNYQLFRYMLGCNAMGDYPTKFNGGLFTSDPCHITGLMNSLADDDLTVLDPDFRCWGGGSFTGQNQRLVYWPMLKSGDFDLMHSQFDYYRRALPGAEARVRHNWGHGGACFTEQLENFGLPFGWGYGWPLGDDNHRRTDDLDPGLLAGRFIRYHYDSQVEFALMIVRYQQFSGLDIERWMPFVRSVLRFYDAHYRFRCRQETGSDLEEDGLYRFSPSTALETFKDAKNPLSVIAGLKILNEQLLALPEHLWKEEDRDLSTAMLGRLPELPTRDSDGHRVFAPAETFNPKPINGEDPQLYAVYPYELVHPGNEWWQVAQDTWDYDDLKRRFLPCWGQTVIWAARLGRTEEVAKLVVEKMQDCGRPFPAFWGPGPDWVPDLDHGGSGAICLQEMLMQVDPSNAEQSPSGIIRLFPAWPLDWDVDFKLHAPGGTIVSVQFQGGRLVRLETTPAARRADIRLPAGLEMPSCETVLNASS
jgi:hypothetical protein